MKLEHESDNTQSSFKILGWIIGGVIGLGLPALSISFTYNFLIHIPKLDAAIQRTGHPLLALMPGIVVALLCLVVAGYWIKKQTKARLLSTIIQLIGVGGIVATVIALWIQVLFVRQQFPVKQIPFNVTQWNQAGCGTSRVRQMMLTGLTQQIRGMTPQQITALLGPNEVGESSYCLGPEPVAIPTDRLVLRVLYDAHGQAADVRISAN
jgi:amino acid transporter